MTVLVHLMSGNIITVDIFDGFLIRNLRHEVYLKEDSHIKNIKNIKNSEQLLFSKIGEVDELDDYEVVQDGDIFRVFVKPFDEIQSPVRLTLDHNGIICLRSNEGFLIDYYGWDLEDRIDPFLVLDTEKVVSLPKGNIILEVDINDDGYETMKREIIKYYMEDDDQESIDNLDELDNERIFDIFFERFIRINNNTIDFIYVDQDYDPEVDEDGDNSWE
jgi:hypothetical protein